MAIADTITSMQNHTSNAYDMIEYGTDLTGINKNLQNLSTSIFKAFIQSLNNPDTLWGNLPKITGTGTNISLNNTIEAPMKIELSPVELTQAGTPTPSSPQAVHTISGSNKVVVSDGNGNSQEAEVDLGTNRLRFPYQEPTTTRDGITYTVNRDGSIKVKGTATATSYINLYQSTSINLLNIGTTYTYSITPSQSNMRLQFYERYNNNWNDKGYGTDKITFTVSSSSAGQMIRLIVNNGSTVDATVYPMINEGSTALPYKEYREPIEYCKIGTYGDRIFKNISTDTDYSNTRDEGAWYIKKNIGNYVLNGSEDWEDRPNFADCDRFVLGITGSMGISAITSAGGLSNYFQISTGVISTIGYMFNNGNSQIGINYSTKGTTSLADFKTWLGTHNTEYWYVLATPTYTKITGTLAEQLENVYQKLLSYTGQTNISQINNDLAFQLGVQAIEKL